MTVGRVVVPLVLLAGLGVTAAPAVAAPTPTPVAVDVAGFGRPDVLAGYRLTTDGGVRHRITATVTVPTVDCTGRPREPLDAGVVLLGRPTTANGTDAVFLLVQALCERGVATYGIAGFSANGGVGIGTSVPVEPGTAVVLTVASTATRSTFTATDRDGRPLLRGGGDSFRVDAAQATTQGGYGGAFPRPTGPVSFTAVRVDGAPLATTSPRRLAQTAGGTVLARASALTGAGDAFVVRFSAPA